jgi:hypothetical protein
MCNLYTTKARAAEIAAAVRAQLPINFNAGDHSISIQMTHADYIAAEAPGLVELT